LLYLPPYSPDLNRIEQRRVLAGESHLQTIRSEEIVYVMRPLDVLRLASGADESGCYISIIKIKNN
jgi:transposase